GEPLHHVGPRLADEVEWRHATLVVDFDIELARIGYAGRLLWPLDGGFGFLFLALLALLLLVLIFRLCLLAWLGARLRAGRRARLAATAHGLHLLRTDSSRLPAWDGNRSFLGQDFIT